MKRWIGYTAAIAFAMTFWVVNAAHAHGFVDENGDGINDNAVFEHHGPRHGFLGPTIASQLTADQKTAIEQKITDLKAQGASEADIRTAVNDLLTSYGITPPSPLDRFGAQLTDAQKATIEQKIADLKAQGASEADIRTAVKDLLTSYGITPPSPLDRFGAQLTDAQKTEIQQKIADLKAQGASEADIHKAVDDLLTGYGITPPSPLDRFGAQLTDEQKAAIEQQIADLKAQGASRADIHAAVVEQLKADGIDVPAGGPPGPHMGRGDFGRPGRRGPRR